MAEVNKDLEVLVHYTTGQNLLEKGDLRSAYREICSAIEIEDRWEYGHQLAKICESARNWVPVARIAVDQSPEWVRTVSHGSLDRDEYVVLRIGSRLEVHSVHDGRLVQQRELSEEDASPTVDVLLVPTPSTAPREELPRLAYLSETGRLTLYTLPKLERVAPAYTSAELQRIPSLSQNSFVRLVSDANGSRIAVPIGRQVVVLDISDPHAVSTIDTIEADRDVESVQLSPQGAKLLFKLSGPEHEAYVKHLLEEQPPERVLVWDVGFFLDENKLIGFRHFAAGGLRCDANIHDLRSKKQTASLIFESLTLSYSKERQPSFRILENMFRKTELTENLLIVINGRTDLKSTPTSSIVKASNLFPNAKAKTRLLYVHPETMTIVGEQGSELFVVRPAQVPVAPSQRKINLPLWNAYQHQEELFVKLPGFGTNEEFALYDVVRLMLPGNLESKQARTTFRLIKPNPTVEGRFILPMGVTMNTTLEGDRLAVLWGEADADTFHAKVHRLEAYVYDKSDVVDAASEVEPIDRVLLLDVGVVDARALRQFVLTPSGKTILLCITHQVFAYDTENGSLRYRTQDLFPDRLPIGFSVAPDQSLAASGDPYQQRTVKVWDVERGTILFETKKKGELKSVAFDMNGRSLWIGWMDGGLDVHRLSNGQLQKSLTSAPAPMLISPTEDRFIGTRTPVRGILGTRELVDSETGAAISGMVLEQHRHILGKGWYTSDGRIVTLHRKHYVYLYNSLSLDSAEQFLSKTFPLETTLHPEVDEDK
jgi:WD40 repeat protein